MNLQVKRFIAAGLVAGSILAMAGTALAVKPEGNNRPGCTSAFHNPSAVVRTSQTLCQGLYLYTDYGPDRKIPVAGR